MRPPTLPEQLGFVSGQRYALVALPDAIRPLFSVLPDGTQQADCNLDIAVLFVSDSIMLAARWADLAPMLTPSSLVWLCWPRAGVLRSDLDQPRVEEMMSARGFHPARAQAVDEVWTALQLSPVARP
ncbi:hypothetical protein [Chitinolyticbacter meiyuanensis]|uniref:hypothetical protein n=1 Tax=Chitinolyticbacter meiyuanensis TaxID=682798 RepID=UPI0011E594A3|nr:hypothetical protein [Chitinolyticbacter meiyuanensis]